MANPIELGVKVTSDTADFEAKTAASERAWGRFTGALTTVESKTTGVLNALKQVGAAAPEALGTMGTAAEGATRSFVRTQETLTGLAASIPRLAGLILGPIGIAIAAAAAVATAAWHVFKDDTFAIFGEVEGEAVTLSEAVGASWEVAKGLARDAFTAIGSFAKEAFAGIKTWFAEMPDDAGQAFDYVQQTAMKSWQRVVDGARWMWELLTGLANAGVQGMVAALPALWDAFKNYFTQIGKVGAAAWDALKTGSLEPLTAQIRESTKSIGESGRSVGSAFAAGFRENLPPAFDDLKRWAGDAWDSIKTRFKGAVAEMRRAATTSDTDGKSGAPRGQELLAAEQALQQALTALERAGIDARRALEQGALDETLRDLQANFQLRKIAEEDYINQSADLQRQKIGKAIAGLNEENDAVVAKIAALVQQYSKLEAAGDTKKALDTQKKIADALREQVGILARIDSAERALNEVERNRGRELEAYTQRQRDANAAAIEAIDRYREKLAEASDQRRFEISLIGKTAEQQQVLRATHAAEVELQRIMNDLRRVEVQIARELVREEGTRQSVIEDLTRQQNVLFQQAADQRVEITRAETDARDKINAESAERLRSGLVDALYNGLMSGRGFANSLRDYFKQVLGTGLRSILQQAVSGLFGGGAGGGGGGILSLLGSLFGGSGGGSGGGNGGGNGGLMSSLFSGIGGLWNSAWGMNLGAGFSGLFGGASQLVSGTIGGMTELGLGFGEALSGAVEALGGFGATLGAVIPVIGIVVAALSALGVFADETGIKIDNSVRGVGNPASHFQQSGLGAFDYSGDIPNSAFDALTRRIQGLDDAVIKAFLDDDTLATVRANIQALTNGDWYGFDDQASAKEAVEKATIRFLKERYGTAFDAVDTQLAGAIRAFAGTSDELMTFIQAATEAKAALDELHRIAPDVKLSVSALLAASDEQRNALTALAATLQMTSSDYWQTAKDALAASQMTLTQALSSQGATVLKLATSFDGSLAAAQALAQAEQQRLQMVAALIQQIGQAALEIKGMFGQSAEQFRLASMTPDQQYYYYDKQAKDTFDALSQATDVSEITRLAQQYNQYLTTAFGLLSPEQRLAKGNDYAALADKANEVSQERLREAEARAREEQDALDGKIEVAVKTAMQVVADKMTAAADKIAAAAETPTTVVVTGRVTVEIDGGAGTQTVDVGLAGIRTAGGA